MLWEMAPVIDAGKIVSDGDDARVMGLGELDFPL